MTKTDTYPLVEFLPGNGKSYFLPVTYISDYARGPDKYGTCAFCQGDPCGDDPIEIDLTPIQAYFQDNKWADSCPFCRGAPT